MDQLFNAPYDKIWAHVHPSTFSFNKKDYLKKWSYSVGIFFCHILFTCLLSFFRIITLQEKLIQDRVSLIVELFSNPYMDSSETEEKTEKLHYANEIINTDSAFQVVLAEEKARN